MCIIRCPASARGANASSRSWGGMQWTRVCLQTNGTSACGKGVWSWRPWAGVKPCKTFCKATVTKRSWTPGRARNKPSNHCAGNADALALPVVTNSYAFLFCIRGYGCGQAPGIPCALFLSRAVRRSTRAISCRENASVCFTNKVLLQPAVRVVHEKLLERNGLVPLKSPQTS
jgi:hypothetical protein